MNDASETSGATARSGFARVMAAPRWLAVLALLAAILAPHLLANTYQINILVLVGIFVMLALSLDLLLGFTGYLSLGHHGLWAIGAYTSALLATKLGASFWIALPAAALFTAAFAAAMAVPAFRVRGHYFALVTLAMGEVINVVILNWVAVTEGPFGLTSIPSPVLPGLGAIDSRLEYYYLVLVAVVVALLAMWRVLESPLGRCFRAIREDEDLAEAQGLHLMHYKVTAYAVSGLITGVAGSLFAHYQGVIGPDNFSLHFMAEILVMVVVGGSGVLAGSVVGPAIFIPLPEISRALGEARLVIFGALLMIMVIYVPEGITGRVQEWLADRRRDSGGRSKSAGGERAKGGDEA